MDALFRSVFLPIPSMSPDQAAALIDVLETAVAELWCFYGDAIQQSMSFIEDDGEGDPLPHYKGINKSDTEPSDT